MSRTGGWYDGDLAHARARERRRRPRSGRLLVDGQLRALVQAKLEVEWSPEQIAGWLRVTFPNRPDWHLCHETIYQALYLGGRGGLDRRLTRRLRTGRPLRKPRRRATERQTRFVSPGRLIDQRPEAVFRRERVGDWEGDLIVGRSNRSAIATLVDRRSRYLHLVALPRRAAPAGPAASTSRSRDDRPQCSGRSWPATRPPVLVPAPWAARPAATERPRAPLARAAR